MNKIRCIVSVRMAVTIAAICLVTTSCALLKLKKEYHKILETTVIIGRIHGQFTENGPIIVAACLTKRGKGIAHYTVVHDAGEYELNVEQGNYYVFAYQDKNSNLIYETGEPAGQYGEPTLVHAPGVGIVFDIDINIPKKNTQISIPYGTEISAVKPSKLYSRQAGDITNLEDARFSDENGTKSFWEPGSFFSELGGNIYFLEKYDPKKIPILFIHGAAGTPRGWKYIVDHIDRTRFQPWFFFYPTGSRIDSMAYLLLWKLINLQSKYQFKTLYITAHSMGGLVARSFIVNHSDQFPYVKLFISMATPWGGDHMAELGVKQSPVLIPSWIDMQPHGDFIKSLYRRKMPEYVNFYMFYGYNGSRNPLRDNNDGTITLSSLLDYRPQSEAKMNYAFNEDHTSILFSKEVLAQYKAIINQYYEEQTASSHRSGGYLKVNFTYTYDFDGIRPGPIFILLPRSKKTVNTYTYLSNDDNGKTLGPFSPGDYYAAMVAMAAKPQKEYIPVTIKDGETKELSVVFTPDGTIRGCVATSLKPDEKYVGRPDYKYRSADENIQLRSIQLEGNGIQRTLRPVEGDKFRKDHLILRDDYCYDKCFGFFGLPAGDYSLTITAEGYKSAKRNYTVKPGAPRYFRITELSPN